MYQNSDIRGDTQPPHDATLERLTKTASGLGVELVDIAGFLDTIDQQSATQIKLYASLRRRLKKVESDSERMRDSASGACTSSEAALQKVETSVAGLRDSNQRTRTVAGWVETTDTKFETLSQTLASVRTDNNNITAIAKQVNILAINAKIEAARAGDSGRGFTVVAEAINTLSAKTATAALDISKNIKNLTSSIQEMRDSARVISSEAGTLIQSTDTVDEEMKAITGMVEDLKTQAKTIAGNSGTVSSEVKSFQGDFDALSRAVHDNAGEIKLTRDRANRLIDSSESMLQNTVAMGGDGGNRRFVDYLTDLSQKISERFEKGIALGEISEAQMFDKNYRPIPGCNPEQFMTQYVTFTDRVLPEFQEAALEFDPKVAFCAAVDKNGFLPTHNRKFSKPQSSDPIWNASNCRNRRVFNDRVGLKAGQNKGTFLLQVYRRDMGGGTFSLMKDLSVPVFVNGRQWGGLRMGISV